MRIEWTALTHVGLQRKINQDAFLLDEEARWAILADGMGGHEAGEIASNVAVETIDWALSEGYDLARSIKMAHGRILETSEQYGDMGTTIVAITCLDERKVRCEWVGDSRAYIFNQDGLRRLTHDHSWVQERIDEGDLTEEEAFSHPRRNVLTRALGQGPEELLFSSGLDVEMTLGTRFLLCSDGLTGLVDDEELSFWFSEHLAPETIVQKLLALVLERGAHDNVTIIVGDCYPEF